MHMNVIINSYLEIIGLILEFLHLLEPTIAITFCFLLIYELCMNIMMNFDYEFILGMDNCDLHQTLEKLSSYQESDEELEIIYKFLSEEKLILLTEMSHTLSDGETIPFYEYINRRLKEMVNTESILGLLYVNVETRKDDQDEGELFAFNNKEFSSVSHLINAMSSPSAQVSNWHSYV